MRPIFQTDYGQDIRLFRHSGYWWSYGVLLLLVLAAPWAVGSYLQSQIVFVFIYAIVGVGLLILATYLTVQRLRGVTLTSDPSVGGPLRGGG